jgi:hypothetical protein
MESGSNTLEVDSCLEALSKGKPEIFDTDQSFRGRTRAASSPVRLSPTLPWKDGAVLPPRKDCSIKYEEPRWNRGESLSERV